MFEKPIAGRELGVLFCAKQRSLQFSVSWECCQFFFFSFLLSKSELSLVSVDTTQPMPTPTLIIFPRSPYWYRVLSIFQNLLPPNCPWVRLHLQWSKWIDTLCTFTITEWQRWGKTATHSKFHRTPSSLLHAKASLLQWHSTGRLYLNVPHGLRQLTVTPGGDTHFSSRCPDAC